MLNFHQSDIAVSGDGLVVTATIVGTELLPCIRAQALVRLDFNGSVLDVTPYWAHQMRINFTSLSALDGALYVAGSADRLVPC